VFVLNPKSTKNAAEKRRVVLVYTGCAKIKINFPHPGTKFAAIVPGKTIPVFHRRNIFLI
jgi:hypothetical protein